MEPNPTTTPPLFAPPAKTGVMGSKIPSTVAFAVGILLFFLPFAEIKCGGTTLANKSGVDLVMGNNWKQTIVSKRLMDKDTEESSSKEDNKDKGNSQLLAIAALGLAVLGFGISFGMAKSSGIIGMLVGLLASGALIAMMFDIKNSFHKAITAEAAQKAQENTNDFGIGKIGDSLSNAILNFTPWFYVAIVAFLAAAVFSYLRISMSKKTPV